MALLARSLAPLFAHGVCLFLILVFGFETLVRLGPMVKMERLADRSTVVRASNQKILWGFLSKDEKWRLKVEPSKVDPSYIRLLIRYEDKRFENHAGVDAVALARAASQAIRHKRVVSGGSTLTMQLVRLLEPKPRTLAAKFDQALKATRLERRFSKSEILGMYLSLAPFGGNIEGVHAASQIYFGRPPKDMTLQQAALLIAIPQSPERRRPDRHPERARNARDMVLARLARQNAITELEATAATRKAIQVNFRPLNRHAPHVARLVAGTARVHQRQDIATTIDFSLQEKVEILARRALLQWDKDVNVAIVVLRNKDAAFVAYSGGSDLHIESRQGHVDLGRAVRSPGSTLKPFIYTLAFEDLVVHPDTIIIDEPLDFNGYAPQNAQLEYSGEMSVREALIRSLNTTAVSVLDAVGINRLFYRLASVGAPLRLPASSGDPGLAIALGGAGVTLKEMVWLYSSYPNDGMLLHPHLRKGDARPHTMRLFERQAALATADILADMPPPAGFSRRLTGDGGRRIGYKTGTSFGFRDAWAVGFDAKYTVGVWLGKPDGSSHLGSYGITAAAPIMMSVFDLLPTPKRDLLSGRLPDGALKSPRKLPKRLVRFEPFGNTRKSASLTITFPQDNSELYLETAQAGRAPLVASVRGGTAPYRWVIGGQERAPQNKPTAKFSVDSNGQHTITVFDATGASTNTSFWVGLASQ